MVISQSSYRNPCPSPEAIAPIILEALGDGQELAAMRRPGPYCAASATADDLIAQHRVMAGGNMLQVSSGYHLAA